MSKEAKYTGQLYQLISSHKLHTGAYVAVNGPHDTYGVVQDSSPCDDGNFRNLIRGVRPIRNKPVVASF